MVVRYVRWAFWQFSCLTGFQVALALALVALPAGLPPAVCLAQAPKGAEEGPKIPEPEDISLTTDDGLALKCTWYAGTAGKQAVPFVLIHEWEGQRTDLDPLAAHLQSLGHAVIAPDLRGHGGSTKIKSQVGADVTLDRKKFATRDFHAMVTQDMQAVKRYLVERNNAGELNIEMLCLVGVEFGSIVAAQFTALDWSWPQLPTYKVGRDVKAVVMVSPLFAFRGGAISGAFANTELRDRTSLMLLAGSKDAASVADLKRIQQLVKRFRTIPTDQAEALKSQNLFVVELDTSLKGSKLAKEPALAIDKRIVNFVTLRLLNKADEHVWAERQNPVAN